MSLFLVVVKSETEGKKDEREKRKLQTETSMCQKVKTLSADKYFSKYEVNIFSFDDDKKKNRS